MAGKKFSRLRRLISRKRLVSEEDGYYLVKFPKNMSRSRETFIGGVTMAVHEKELPIVFDFTAVKKFDSSGAAAVVVLFGQYKHRGVSAYGVSSIITKEMEVDRLSFIFEERIPVYDRLEDLLAAS